MISWVYSVLAIVFFEISQLGYPDFKNELLFRKSVPYFPIHLKKNMQEL